MYYKYIDKYIMFACVEYLKMYYRALVTLHEVEGKPFYVT